MNANQQDATPAQDSHVAARDPHDHAHASEKSGNLAGQIALPLAMAGGLFCGILGFFLGLGATPILGLDSVINAIATSTGLGLLLTNSLAGLAVGAIGGGLVGALAGVGVSSGNAH